MEDSIAETSALARSIYKSCTSARTSKSQCWALQMRCTQVESYILAWKTNQNLIRYGAAMSELVTCFKRALKLVKECGRSDWFQQVLVRHHAEHEFGSILTDLETLVDILSTQVVANVSKVVDDQQFARTELLEAAERDRVELLEHLNDGNFSQVLSRIHRASELESLELSYTEVDWEGLPLGRGASGMVYRGTWLGYPVAVKIFRRDDQTFMTELEAMSKLTQPHPNLLQVLGYTVGSGEQTLVMELMKMDLKRFLQRRNDISSLTAVNIMLQIARGARHLHEHSIVHRDLKPQNVLVDFDDEEAETVKVKLTDFGIAKTEFDTLLNEEVTHLKGTPLYMAPEMLAEGGPRYSRKVDVYSFAVTCCEILTRLPPYGMHNPGLEVIKRMVTAGDRPQLPENCPEKLRDLIIRCWSADSDARPSFAVIEEELLEVKRRLIAPSLELTMSTISTSSSSTSMNFIENRSPAPSVTELRLSGSPEVGSTISVGFRPQNGTRFTICRWVRKRQGTETTALQPLLVIADDNQELKYTTTAADFNTKLVFECLPLNSEFKAGKLVTKSTEIIRHSRSVRESIEKSWILGQTSFRVEHVHHRWWEPLGKLYVNRKDYHLWWGQGNPSNLRLLFMEVERLGFPLEVCEDAPLLCRLKKIDGSSCLIKFSSSSTRDLAVLTMRYFWERRLLDNC